MRSQHYKETNKEDVGYTQNRVSLLSDTKDVILPFAAGGMLPEGVMLREISQMEKDKHCDFTPMWCIENLDKWTTKGNKNKCLAALIQLVVAGGERERGLNGG